MATSNVSPVSAVEKLTAKKKFFDLSKFEKVSKEITVEFVPVSDLAGALARVENKQETLVVLLNSVLRRKAKMDAKQSFDPGDENLITSSPAINAFVNQFRAVPTYSKIADKKEQTKAIYAFIAANEAIKNALKVMASAVPDSGEEDDDEDGE